MEEENELSEIRILMRHPDIPINMISMKKKTPPIRFDQIHIPSPCHENWGQMSGREKSRYCESCQKEVFDFTDGDESYLQTVWEATEGQFCGRYRLSDLSSDMKKGSIQKPISVPLPYILRSRISRIAFSLLAFTGLQNAFAKDSIQVVYVDTLWADHKLFDPIEILDIMGNVCIPFEPELEETRRQYLFLLLETEQQPEPDKKQETEEESEIPQKSPIIPVLNRMPAIMRNRGEGDKKDKNRKRPWR